MITPLPDALFQGALEPEAKLLERISSAGKAVLSDTIIAYLDDTALRLREHCARTPHPDQALIAERDALRAELKRRTELEKGHVWYWQGDGTDHPESLTCQVVIGAEAFRELLAAKEQSAAILSQIERLARTENLANG